MNAGGVSNVVLDPNMAAARLKAYYRKQTPKHTTTAEMPAIVSSWSPISSNYVLISALYYIFVEFTTTSVAYTYIITITELVIHQL